MDSPEEEIQANLVIGNFNRSHQLAELWLASIPLTEKDGSDYLKAKEAFVYSRFFLHRQERSAKMKLGAERARTFLQFLHEIKELRDENGFSSASFQSSYWQSVHYFIHTQIAEGLAHDFAGQKSYNLELEEVMQLATSLSEIENWKAAEEALLFVYQVNPRHALANFLLANVYFHSNIEGKFQLHLREALFLKPDLLAGYTRFLPSGVFQELWEHIDERDIADIVKYRYYALTLEINGLYKKKRKMAEDEFRRLEQNFAKIQIEYKENLAMRDEIEPRVLHYLCWIIEYCQQLRFFDKFEEYRALMIDIDLDVYTTFQEKGLSSSLG